MRLRISPAVAACLVFLGSTAVAQQRPSQSAAQPLPDPKTWTAAEDHRQMMGQLGIKALRPGPSGNEQDPNHANYDESKANPFPDLPPVLTLKNGRRVTTREQWRQRRAEIAED